VRSRGRLLELVLSPDGRGAAWCGGDCVALTARALEEAVAGLVATQGPDPAAWRWGAVHVARFEHPLLRFVPLFGRLAELAAPTGGDDRTLLRGGLRGTGPNPWESVHGAGLRLVADLAAPDGIQAVIATGQSGHPLSAHWGDQLAPWRDGSMITLSRAAPAIGGRISLMP